MVYKNVTYCQAADDFYAFGLSISRTAEPCSAREIDNPKLFLTRENN